jgi:type I restriction enzyme M protein
LTASPPPTNGTGQKPNRTFSLIWSIAELLRGDVKPAAYGSFILPMTVLRRLDCELEKTKAAVVKAAAKVRDLDNLRIDEKSGSASAAGRVRSSGWGFARR